MVKFKFKINLVIIIICDLFFIPSIAKSKSCSTLDKFDQEIGSSFLESQNELADQMTRKMQIQFNRANASVVLLGNVAKDISNRDFETPSNLNGDFSIKHKFMHTGLAYKDPKTNSWKIIHLNNVYDHCGKYTNKSIVSNDGLRTFFSKALHMMDIQYAIPSPELQKKLLNAILSEADSLHNSKYNLISNPNSLQFQNSNQFILNFIAAAQKNSEPCQNAITNAVNNGSFKRIGFMDKNRFEAQLCATATGFKPTIAIGKISEAAEALKPNSHLELTIKDHDATSILKSRFPFVSAESVFDYLKTSDPDSTKRGLICPPMGCNKTAYEIYTYYENRKNQNWQTSLNDFENR